MRFQLAQHDWPCSAVTVPVGTMLDKEDWTYAGAPLPWPPPVNALALDQEAYDFLLAIYPYYQVLSVPHSGDVVRHGDPKKGP
jgi:hypothetical protein